VRKEKKSVFGMRKEGGIRGTAGRVEKKSINAWHEDEFTTAGAIEEHLSFQKKEHAL